MENIEKYQSLICECLLQVSREEYAESDLRETIMFDWSKSTDTYLSICFESGVSSNFIAILLAMNIDNFTINAYGQIGVEITIYHPTDKEVIKKHIQQLKEFKNR